MRAFAERHEGAVPVFVRGSDTLIRASPFLIERVVADLLVSIVEMYTSGEIVEARKPFTAETAENALLVANDWINDGQHNSRLLSRR
jgi:hypothetical protein